MSGPFGHCPSSPASFSWHGACVPPEAEGTLDASFDARAPSPAVHVAEAAVSPASEVCREPTQIARRRSARWHLYDTLCPAAYGPTAAIDGGPSAYATAVSGLDGTFFLGPPSSPGSETQDGRTAEGQYDGTRCRPR